MPLRYVRYFIDRLCSVFSLIGCVDAQCDLLVLMVDPMTEEPSEGMLRIYQFPWWVRGNGRPNGCWGFSSKEAVWQVQSGYGKADQISQLVWFCFRSHCTQHRPIRESVYEDMPCDHANIKHSARALHSQRCRCEVMSACTPSQFCDQLAILHIYVLFIPFGVSAVMEGLSVRLSICCVTSLMTFLPLPPVDGQLSDKDLEDLVDYTPDKGKGRDLSWKYWIIVYANYDHYYCILCSLAEFNHLNKFSKTFIVFKEEEETQITTMVSRSGQKPSKYSVLWERMAIFHRLKAALMLRIFIINAFNA